MEGEDNTNKMGRINKWAYKFCRAKKRELHRQRAIDERACLLLLPECRRHCDQSSLEASPVAPRCACGGIRRNFERLLFFFRFHSTRRGWSGAFHHHVRAKRRRYRTGTVILLFLNTTAVGYGRHPHVGDGVETGCRTHENCLCILQKRLSTTPLRRNSVQQPSSSADYPV